MTKNLPRYLGKTIICLVFALIGLPAFSQEPDFVVDNISYSINTDGKTVTIVKDEYADPTLLKGRIVIPDVVKSGVATYSVTAIGSEAFSFCEEMTECVIGNNVKSIGMVAFHMCKNMTAVTIPSSVNTIFHAAFLGCESLEDVTIPESVTAIYGGAFSGCALKSITVPASVKTFENGVFASNSQLKEINVAPGSTILSSMDGILYNLNGDVLMQYPAGKPDEAYTIPSNVKTIFESGFEGCNNLKAVTFPKTLNNIQDAAFANSRSLRDIYCEWETPLYIPNESIFDPTIYDYCILHVPDGSMSKYKSADVWKLFKEIIEMSDVEVTALEIVPSELRILRGDTKQLEVKYTPENASNKIVLWYTDNDKVADIDMGGELVAVEPGECTITCTTLSGKISATMKVTVYDEFNSVEEIDSDNVKITARDGRISADGFFKVYNAMGSMVFAGSGDAMLPAGIYVVLAGNKTVKVIL